MRDRFYKPPEEKAEVYLVWGVKELDRSEVSIWDFDEDGDIVWDS